MKNNTFLLGLISFLVLGTLYISYTNSLQIKALRHENSNLYSKIDSALQVCRQQPQQPITKATDPKPRSTVSGTRNNSENKKTTPAKAKTKQKIVVTSKYRIEDRYVDNKIKEPEFKGNETGSVVINILVNWAGEVKSAKPKSVTGITNEDVIEACKKAALRTHFNIAPHNDYEKDQSGTITYTFSAE